METIYLVIEQGAGVIWGAFRKKEDAQKLIDEKESATNIYCYDIKEIKLI